MNEYELFLKKIQKKISPYLNTLGIYFDNSIEKFIGFNDYEIILIEFEEFLTDTELAINFHRYTNCLDEKYKFVPPKSNSLYGTREINLSHWKYYPEGADKKDKEQLNLQLEIVAEEMLGQIKLKLEPCISTDYPVDVYIKEKYIEVTDEMALEISPDGYTFEDEWFVMNEERISSMPWWSNLCNEQYNYVSQRRDEILSYKAFYYEMMKRYETNRHIHQKEIKRYLSQYKQAKFIKPKYQYHFIREVMNTKLGHYVETELTKHGFLRQESMGCHRNNQEAFYSNILDIEIYFVIYDGIRWAFSYSIPDEYGMLTVNEIEADCSGLCLIDDEKSKEKVDEAIEKLLVLLSCPKQPKRHP